MKRNTADAQQAALERQALVDSLPPCKVPKWKILQNLEADDELRAAAEQRAMSSHVPLGMYGDGVPYHRDPDPGNVKYESDDYAVYWYKKKNMVGIRQKKGDKDQIFAFGSKHSGLTEEEMKKLGDEALQNLDCGMSPEEVKEWAMQAVAPWGSDDELLADVLFAWKKKWMSAYMHVWIAHMRYASSGLSVKTPDRIHDQFIFRSAIVLSHTVLYWIILKHIGVDGVDFVFRFRHSV